MDAAIVSVHGSRVGTLRRTSSWEDYRFEFDPEWIDAPDRPLLGQIFVDRMPDPIVTSGLPCWFAHLLPQGASRRLMERWLTVSGEDDFSLLVGMGRDLPGATTLEPTTPTLFGTGGYAAARPPHPGAPGFSLPGAQHKISIRVGERGLVIPVWGETGDHIAKFHDPTFTALPQLEWATTEWACNAGIRTHAIRLAAIEEFVELPPDLPVGDGTVLLADRFDRTKHGKVHVEDFGQLLDLPPGNTQYASSHEALARVVAALCPPENLREYVERLVFVIVSGNGDAHIKNWSVAYPDRHRAVLAPAFDLVATVARIPNDDLALTLGGRREFARITWSAFDGIAHAMGVDAAEVHTWAKQAAARARDAWIVAREAFSMVDRARIERHMDRLPLLRSGQWSVGSAGQEP